ncbi:MAG: protein kinase domain-containing protein [Steroidobacteraceae bacterium]
MTEAWAKWEKEVINGVFPLHRAVSFSDHSAVFLTEYQPLNLPHAVLKLVPAIPTLKEAQLAHWSAAASLAHPNLIRLVQAGRCQLGGLQFLFVVMEYAQLTLEGILSQHALAPEAVRKTLRPILASLRFLHRQQLVQGGLKPSNILLVDQEVKLASDTVRSSGESTASIAGSSVYDPPESSDGSFSTAGDIWSLGVFMVEALTQCRPSWPDRHSSAPVLPETLPAQFVQIIRRCLSRNPAHRPTVAELEAEIGLVPQTTPRHAPIPDVPIPEIPALPQPLVPHMSLAEALVTGTPMAASLAAARFPVLSPPRFPVLLPAEPADPTPTQLEDEEPEVATVVLQAPKRRSFVPAGAVILVVAMTVWTGLRLLGSQGYSISTGLGALEAFGSTHGPAATAQTPASATAAPTEVPTDSVEPGFAESQTVVAPASVLHEEAPDVPPGALETIRGHIKFAVRVTVDGAGNVVQARLINHSPSRYFTRLAIESARRWKFAAADNPASRQWLLRFEFTRDGATARANNPRISRTDRSSRKTAAPEMRQAKIG